MSRRVLIRSRSLETAVAQLEDMVAADYKEIFKQHFDDLEETAQAIEQDAREMAPKLTGKLSISISVHVSHSNRWPGIIATASAKNNGYDYALIQEENEDYSHYGPKEQAHYLSQPFVWYISDLYERLTDKELELPDDLQDISDYEPNPRGKRK